MNALRIAFSFLTVLPVAPSTSSQPEDIGKASIWFPFVGATLGLILALAGWTASFLFSPLIVGILITTIWAMLTGGLHLDGLADCCDGLFVSKPAERRLEIMKDSRLGTFGGAGLILILILKTILVAELAKNSLWLPLILACSVGRWAILLAAIQPQARPGGLGAAFAQGVGGNTILLSSLIPLALLVWGRSPAVLAVALALALEAGVITLARRRLGGVTGDVFGMIVELSEVMVLLGLSIKII